MRPDSVLRPGLASAVPADAEVVVAAPGRANLIGEHTDYNDGFVLPVALELLIVVAGRRSSRIRLRSGRRGRPIEVDPTSGDGPTEGWGRYVTAVVRALREDGVAVRGLEGVIVSNLPAGSGLASSAALEVALALALSEASLDPVRVARICQRAENVHVGVRSGIMDQLASVASRSGSATLIDCRSLELHPVPVPDELRVLVIHSGERRQLAKGDYNRRREECEEAARRLRVGSLRDADLEAVERARLPEPLDRRARHVVTENARVLATVDALAAGELARVGDLLAASHASLARDFEVSTPSLDLLVEIAREVPGVIGARMTGAGFGGCTVNLVEASAAEEAAKTITARYAERSERQPQAWISKPGAGADELQTLI